MARNTPICQPTISTPRLPPPVAALSAKIDAGAFVRCPSCYNWCNRNKIQHVALYVPHDGRPPVAYAICRHCWNKFADEQSDMIARIESYLDGAL